MSIPTSAPSVTRMTGAPESPWSAMSLVPKRASLTYSMVSHERPDLTPYMHTRSPTLARSEYWAAVALLMTGDCATLS